jgi:ribonuclease Z
MSFKLTILGSNSAKPAYGRFTTSQYLDLGPQAILIDAGEAVQLQIERFGLKPNKINTIVISHLHGDHILGLPGLLSSFSLSSRTKAIDIYSPPGLEEWINVFRRISGSYINYPISYHEITEETAEVIVEEKNLSITAFPVKHRVPTYGYLFKEIKSELNINSDKIKEYDLSIEEILAIKKGEDLIREEITVANHKLILKKPTAPKSYAFCADTDYTETFLETIKNVDLIYHEATYLKDKVQQARERLHSTAEEAATIARMAGAKKLLIGHYSSRYKHLTPLLDEAKAVFNETYLAIEGEEHFL